jgi:hypothetical protein
VASLALSGKRLRVEAFIGFWNARLVEEAGVEVASANWGT